MRKGRRRPVEQPLDALKYALETSDAGTISETVADILNLGEYYLPDLKQAHARITCF